MRVRVWVRVPVRVRVRVRDLDVQLCIQYATRHVLQDGVSGGAREPLEDLLQ